MAYSDARPQVNKGRFHQGRSRSKSGMPADQRSDLTLIGGTGPSQLQLNQWKFINSIKSKHFDVPNKFVAGNIVSRKPMRRKIIFRTIVAQNARGKIHMMILHFIRLRDTLLSEKDTSRNAR